jgi:hypothetical protein
VLPDIPNVPYALVHLQLRRTQNTNDDREFADDAPLEDEMDYDQDDDAPVEDAMESEHYNSAASHNESSMDDARGLSQHLSNDTYYYPQFDV